MLCAELSSWISRPAEPLDVWTAQQTAGRDESSWSDSTLNISVRKSTTPACSVSGLITSLRKQPLTTRQQTGLQICKEMLTGDHERPRSPSETSGGSEAETSELSKDGRSGFMSRWSHWFLYLLLTVWRVTSSRDRGSKVTARKVEVQTQMSAGVNLWSVSA